MATQTQATGGKGKKKNKEVLKVSLDEFNQIETPVGHSVVNVKVSSSGLDWAATMASYDNQSADTQQIIVPSAPRAHRGPDIDFESLPNEPPFRVSLFNLPFSVEEKDIAEKFFTGLKVLNVETNKTSTTVELGSKDDLYNALCKEGSSLKGKQISVCLYGQQPQQSNYNSGGYGNRSYGDRYDKYGSDNRYDRSSNNYGQARNDRYNDRPSYGRDSYNSGGPARQGMGSYNANRSGGGGFSDRYNDRGNFRERDGRNNFSSQGMDEAPRDDAKNWRDRPTPVPPMQPAYNNHGSRNPYSRQEIHHHNYQQSSHQQQYRSDPHHQPRYNNQPSNSNHPHSSQIHSDNKPASTSESRPKLQLNKRSLPLRQDEPSTMNPAIFGQAKPSNKPYEKMMEVEEKLKSVTIKDKISEGPPSKPSSVVGSQTGSAPIS